MQDNSDKHIENFVDKAMKDSDLKTPSFDFTNKIMSQIEASKTSVTVYKPLITKQIWILLGIILVSILGYTLFGNSTNETSWLQTLDLNILSDNKLTNALSSFKLPKTVMYSLILFALMICVQVTYLKNYFNKRFEA